MIKIYTDAATKGNPGPTGLGVLILADKNQIQLTDTLAMADNHQGEFAAAEFGFDYLRSHYPDEQTILFYTDSRLLSDAVGKNYAKHYKDELERLSAKMDHFPTVVTQWVPEKENTGAHHLANQALSSIE
ncbi:MAG: ribonuclease HI family protein [Limosilactobacillus sp.]|uniref:ribonuclease HI family protein n=1 Tax=Limosilactobacillus sp. TaxID=2773925 RepID=UPI0026F4872D|nr:ribonuclease HI family protein [Limosilactobacillus sp.]